MKNMENPSLQDALESGVYEKFTTDYGEEKIKCTVCNTSVTGSVPAAAHLIGSKHKKKVNLASGIQSPLRKEETSSNSSDSCFMSEVQKCVVEGVLKESTKDGAPFFHCTLCNKSMSGHIPATAHINSVKHQKKLGSSFSQEQSSLNESCSDASNSFADAKVSSSKSKDPGIYTSIDNEINFIEDDSADILLAKNISLGIIEDAILSDTKGFRCVTCNVFLNGSANAAAHLGGKQHLINSSSSGNSDECSTSNKISKLDLDYDMQQLYLQGMLEYNNNSHRCLLCCVDCNSLLSLRCHLNSNRHVNAIKKYGYFEFAKETESTSHLEDFEKIPVVIKPEEPVESLFSIMNRSREIK